jgi:parvulin-like peptidyl-prolyl isomerase
MGEGAKVSMKKIVFALSMLAIGSGLFVFGYFFKPVTQHFQKPHALVRVNGIEISDLDLKREMLFLKVSDSSPISDITREDILDRMINDVLIQGEASRHKITVADEDVTKYLDSFWAGYEPKETKRILRENQLSVTAWRELVRKRLVVERAIKQLIEDQVTVSTEEVDEYYYAHATEFDLPPRVWARQIVVETQAQAEALKARLNKGENFKELARQYSRGPEKEQGGDLGWVTAPDLPQSFSRVLFKLNPGEISAPITTDYGFHLFMLEKKENGGHMPLEEAKTKVSQDLKMTKTDQVFQTWLENLRGRAAIQMLDHRGGE